MLAELVKKRRETYVCNESLDVQKEDSIRKRQSTIITTNNNNNNNHNHSNNNNNNNNNNNTNNSNSIISSDGNKGSNLLPAIAKSLISLPGTKDHHHNSNNHHSNNREAQLDKLVKSLPNDPRDSKSIRQLENKKLELRKEVIGGDFMNSYIDCYGNMITTLDMWQVREWQLLVFISSTFTDTRYERNILLDKILPYLRSTAYPHDIEVTFVDMR